MSDVFQRPCNVNVYLTAMGATRAMAAHNDQQCTLIVQLSGAKRWRVWVSSFLIGSTDDRLVLGKHPGKELDEASLGPPSMEACLYPGDLLLLLITNCVL